MATIDLEGLLIGLIECDDGALGGVECVMVNLCLGRMERL
jgi:hypothetical protein